MTEDVDGEFFEQPAGLGQADGDVRLSIEQGVDGGKAGRGDLVGRQPGAAGNGDGGDAPSGRGGGHPDRGLPAEALLVEAALTRDDKRCSCEEVVEIDQVQNEFNAGTQGGV